MQYFIQMQNGRNVIRSTSGELAITIYDLTVEDRGYDPNCFNAIGSSGDLKYLFEADLDGASKEMALDAVNWYIRYMGWPSLKIDQIFFE